MKFDAIVCGAGSAGCVTTIMLAKKQLLNVALLDRKPQKRIGRKVCGDAIAEFHFKMAQKELDIPFPTGAELQKTILGIDLYSPNQQDKIRLGSGHKGFIINRHLFGQRLLGYALDAGAHLFDETQVQDLIINNNQITGVMTKSKKDREVKKLEAKVVIDATGATGVLRKRLTPKLASGIELYLSKVDIGYAYREIRELKQKFTDNEYLRIYFSKEIAPGGYIWLFPRGNDASPSVNAGVGITQAIPPPSPKERFYQYMKKSPLFEDSSLITGGAGLIPMRRPNKSFVTNGLVLVGDAGWQVNPANAGGLGTTLEAGIMAGKAIGEAISADSITPEGLWNYNMTYHRTIGARHAPQDIFRLLLNQIRDSDLNIFMAAGLLKDNELDRVSSGRDFEIRFTEKLRRAYRGRKIIRTLLRMQRAVKCMKKIKKLYLNYPSTPDKLEAWNGKVLEIYKGLHPEYR